MITIVITSYNEPKSTEHAINCILNQNIPKPYRIIVSDPFSGVHKYLKEKFKNKIELFDDPDAGKSTALNLILSKIYTNNTEDIIIFTDGDVFTDKNAIKEILKKFKNSEVGVVTAKPMSIDNKNKKFGFFAHFQFYVMDLLRKEASKSGFVECSGYLFAIRNGVIKEFPTNSCEDSVIPRIFFQKGYKVAYAENSKVYVKNPDNLKEWINQRKRNIKGHSTIELQKNSPRKTKTFFNEILFGMKQTLLYPKSLKEYFWILQFLILRLYVWILAYYEQRLIKKQYQDGWRIDPTYSTSPLDRK